MDHVLYRQEGAVAIITLNRPEQRNILSSDEMQAALLGAIERLANDHVVKVAILTGAGAAFSAGGDIKKIAETAGKTSPPVSRTHYINGIQRIPLAMSRLELPVIAAVNGPAVGVGLDLACMCDIRIAAQSAKFAESFVKIGYVPGDGGAWLLPRVVGLPKALEMSLTGDMIDADEALTWGLVTKVVPDEQLMDVAMAMASRIASNPGFAVRMTKQLLHKSGAMSLEDLLNFTATAQAIAASSDEHKQAVEAALAALQAKKRRPKEN
ncbi:enoyl-CoA hydratase-related protein [Sphingobium phenoxybenzoativorans]|uniref:enoyl-CoA hydratase-related protein n=1 Tax=Sphingobium phenoxybenzoativorans TaxID=1592790 RepID=UPI000872F5B3|nr:enoyl-CoA hydratase-related protein [Sphingobium phenoxybenzoativorans]